MSKLASDGKVLWAVAAQKANANHSPRNIAIDSVGNLYIVGISNPNWFLSKLDSSGKLLWETNIVNGWSPGIAVDRTGEGVGS